MNPFGPELIDIPLTNHHSLISLHASHHPNQLQGMLAYWAVHEGSVRSGATVKYVWG